MRLPISLGNTHLKNAVETLLPLLVLSSISANNSYLVWLSHKAGRFVECLLLPPGEKAPHSENTNFHHSKAFKWPQHPAIGNLGQPPEPCGDLRSLRLHHCGREGSLQRKATLTTTLRSKWHLAYTNRPPGLQHKLW